VWPGSGARAAGETLMIVTPNEFDGSDVERINKAIAAASGRRVVIPRENVRGGSRRDVWLLDSAILLKSDTTLELDNCRIKLSDRCRDNFMRSANCGMGITDIKPMRNVHIRGIGRAVLEGADRPRATGDGNKTLGAHTYGTDAKVAGESPIGDWRNIGILLAFVEGFSVQNIAIHDSHGWAISLERCSHGTVRDIDFASSGFKMIDGGQQTIVNQDGLDLRMGCNDILIENITGYAGDDLVALTAIPFADHAAGAVATHMVSNARNRGEGLDDIRNVIIRNVRGYSRGGHHIVRFLNAPGVRMYGILLDGLIDTSPKEVTCRVAVKIGDPDWGSGGAALGDTSRIIIQNVISRAAHGIRIAGSLTDSAISNVLQENDRGQALTVDSTPAQIRDVTTTNVRTVGTGK
jgi:polygalacturonase